MQFPFYLYVGSYFVLRLLNGNHIVKHGTKLTAVEYHYATQCLPIHVAWYVYQLPPLLHQFAVAGIACMQSCYYSLQVLTNLCMADDETLYHICLRNLCYRMYCSISHSHSNTVNHTLYCCIIPNTIPTHHHYWNYIYFLIY